MEVAVVLIVAIAALVETVVAIVAMFVVAMDGTAKIVVNVSGVEAMVEHRGILDVEQCIKSVM